MELNKPNGFDASNFIAVKNLQQKTEHLPPTEEVEESTNDDERKYTTGHVVTVALSAAVLAGAAVHGRGKSVINGLKKAVKKGQEEISELSGKIGELNEANTKLQEEIDATRGRFEEIFSGGDGSAQKAQEVVFASIEKDIDNGRLDYDILNPPSAKPNIETRSGELPLPERVGTTNRANFQAIHIPEISPTGQFSFALPKSSEMRIGKLEQSVDFEPITKQTTGISENYASSVNWNQDKIARDILQNFYDGHGQTLDGVRFDFIPLENGRYRVKISGESTFSPDKAILIGESSKKDDPKAAGNYGEGLKMAVLKLLKEHGAGEVRIGSDNWRVTYSLESTKLSKNKVLAYSVDKEAHQLDGNYLEFETSDLTLLESLRKSINRFYHSGNEHFKCPDFENEFFGLKKLAPGEKGGVYICGQRFEFNGDYDGLADWVIFFKEKLTSEVIDVSRDRISLDNNSLEKLGFDLAFESTKLKVEDRPKLFKVLESCWKDKSSDSRSPMDTFLSRVICYSHGAKIKFPEKYIAYSPADPSLISDLESKGYIICYADFAKWGMPTIKEFMTKMRAHNVVTPSKTQTKKIMIIREALAALAPALKGKHFTPEELSAKIYLFDNQAERESKIYADTLAEAIIENGSSKGFWLDKTYLDTAKLSDILETALHELSHKVGGDGSPTFGYKLTDVNGAAINQLMEDSLCRTKLRALSQLWQELGTA